MILAPDRLQRLAREHGPSYQDADPFPHAVMEGLLSDDVLDELAASFATATGWETNDSEAQVNKRAVETMRSEIGRRVVAELNGPETVTFLEELTGITGLIPDPHLYGGGLHQIGPGGLLKVHADFNRHPRLGLERRLNLIVYLNRDWQPEWGGALELWAQDMSECRARVVPEMGRCVVFSTLGTAYHGHPEPLRCPPDVTRKSLALYYYTAGEVTPHSTRFQRRPGEEFRDPVKAIERRAKLRRWIPPALLDATRRFR